MTEEYSVPLMHSTSTPVWVIFKSTFLPFKDLFFFFAKAWSMLFRTSFCFLSLVSSSFHTHLSQSQHPLFTASGQRSFFIHIFSPFSPIPCSFLPLSYSLTQSIHLWVSFAFAFFKLSLLMFLGVPLSLFMCAALSTLSVANRWRISVCVPPLLF